MKQIAGSYNQPFTLRPSQIWNLLDARQRAALVVIYHVDQDNECLEQDRLRQHGCCRPPDEWRWMAFTAPTSGPAHIPALQERLHNEIGMGVKEALDVLRVLETRGLIRCQQDRWAADDRLYVRILFLGQRVVRDGQRA